MEFSILVLSVFFFFIFLSSFHPVHAFHEIHPAFQSLHVVNVSHRHNPGYHFRPKKNWINDPNGPMYYKGIYHLFYQYNPKGSVWGNIVWAHSVSKDLINWEALEPAIYPSEPFDKYGCWSGSATIQHNGKPVILYTGIINPKPDPGHQVVNYAIPANYSDPYLRKWIKPANNPIISPTNGENSSAWRDPTTAWYQDRHWKILVGGRRRVRGMAYLYKSKDFVRWIKVKHPLHSQRFTGMWECPDFFPVSRDSSHGLDTSTVGEDVKHVLKVSLDSTRYEYYTIGRYDHVKEKYVPDNKSVDGWAGLRYDYGNYYASKTFFDTHKERRILWGWANESDTALEDVAKGWAGIQLIPRTLWLDPSGKQLLQWPIEELKSLRGDNVSLTNVHLRKGTRDEVKGITAAQADVEVTFSFKSLENAEAFDPKWTKLATQDVAQQVCKERGPSVQGGVGPFGLLTLASRNLEEYTPVFFRVFKTDQDGLKHKVLMCSDASSSSLKKGLYKPPFAAFLDVDLGANRRENKISLRSLIDHSVVESFGAGGKVAITSRVYPTLAVSGDAHLYVFNNGSESVTVNTLEAWSMTNPLIS